MSTLESIVEWAEKDLIAWQSDAARRFLTQDEVGESDKLQIMAMLKERHSLGDPENPAPKPQPLKKGHVSGVPQTHSTVTLKAMRIDCNVNAIPNGSILKFGHEGLSVIYGENGSGKSGYARVLKRACSARDSKESILPNAFTISSPGQAKACIKVSIDNGPDQKIDWEYGQDPNPVLSNICVFDSKCARVIVNESNEITYLPYGAHVFEALASLLQDVRRELEVSKPKPKKLEYLDIPDSTYASKWIAGLSNTTSTDDIDRYTNWLDNDEKYLIELKKRVSDAEVHDPQQLAQRIRNLKKRVDKLQEIIIAVDTGLSENKEQELQIAIENLTASEKALSIASQESLANEPLHGAGEGAWQKLFNAAKSYSIEKAYQDQEFPVLEENSLCVLCMQPLLEDAKKRMLRFKIFMETTTKRDVEVAHEILGSLKKGIESIIIPTSDEYKDILDEIHNRVPQFANQLKEYLKQAINRQLSMIQATINIQIQTFPDIDAIPFDNLDRIAMELEREAQEIEKTSDPVALANMKTECNEKDARRLLNKKKKEILDYVEQLKIARKYDACIAETDTKEITLKGKKILSKSLTPMLRQALREELMALKISNLQLNLKPTGSKGETLHRMELVGCRNPQKANLTDILSEGEQHVIAIAVFLAELQLAKTQSPIVFDDPVCSLDHIYREKIAQRLAKEAKTRQVLIFTHDIAFLLELNIKAGELQACLHLQTIQKMGNLPGNSMGGLPWHAMSVKNRISYLNTLLDEFPSLYKTDLHQYNKKAGELYGLLRETWEAVIEEVLFQRTILRHTSQIKTNQLSYVIVTNEDYRTIDMEMSKCSKWMYGHDKSNAIDMNRPIIEEIQNDIGILDNFVKSINKRKDEIRQIRLASLKPKIPAIG
ncbi:MAG: AAA family ATPase [Candidatus Latescibacter sp.]|nr:AAA family ATPase [Candidatus Latescibacter sp.]